MAVNGLKADMQEDANNACWRRIGVWSSQTPSCPELRKVSHCHNCDVFKQAASAVSLNSESGSDDQGQTSEGDWSLVPFRMGSVWLALPSSNIITLAPVQDIHSIPRRSNIVLHGIVAVQGEIYVSLSLSKLMGLNREESTQPDFVKGVFERLVIANIGDVRIAFKVDEVREVMRIYKQGCSKIVDEFSSPIDQYIQCCFPMSEEKPMVCGVVNEDVLAAELHKVLE